VSLLIISELFKGFTARALAAQSLLFPVLSAKCRRQPLREQPHTVGTPLGVSLFSRVAALERHVFGGLFLPRWCLTPVGMALDEVGELVAFPLFKSVSESKGLFIYFVRFFPLFGLLLLPGLHLLDSHLLLLYSLLQPFLSLLL